MGQDPAFVDLIITSAKQEVVLDVAADEIDRRRSPKRDIRGGGDRGNCFIIGPNRRVIPTGLVGSGGCRG